MEFTTAIVRRPARSLVAGIASSPELGAPDYDRALRQHDAYIAALEAAGLRVEVLPADEAHPDSCFVEDVAVCADSFAMVTRPGAPSRRDEPRGIAETLSRHFAEIGTVEAPGTLEGGDVLRVDGTFFIGLSARTNGAGADALARALEKRGFRAVMVPVRDFLHLKTGTTYLGDGKLLVTGEFEKTAAFERFERVVVPAEEAYAVNCLRLNDAVVVPAGYPKTLAAIRAFGCRAIEVDTSEYRKIDGGLTCLSLRF